MHLPAAGTEAEIPDNPKPRGTGNSMGVCEQVRAKRRKAPLTSGCASGVFVCMKRTTLVLEEAILEGIREIAHRRKTEMSRIVNEWLSAGLQRERSSDPAPPPVLPVFHMGLPRVNLADRDQLERHMEQP